MEHTIGQSRLIDVPALVDACTEEWHNQTLCPVNDCVVRLGVVRGEFHWHKHDHEDEFFFVVDGKLYLDIEGEETMVLYPKQGYTVPQGVVHRTRAEEQTVMLMVEANSVDPRGD
ncbi:MAG: cupin domain-containing protein [Planctomycetota bacterium]